ncbi:uncharacterized protein LOC119848385 isoform X2 [Dermochelys coriacea]|uniref:uncharacterized protein LOC119848385 isoform X2 n=1 Tax=Dermochelys coriacea TaxID=27794 RepID=UPI0018E776FD|nr:uncharacterized protein LOC119848385 isoform X2 [Dermochelys coriacea]
MLGVGLSQASIFSSLSLVLQQQIEFMALQANPEKRELPQEMPTVQTDSESSLARFFHQIAPLRLFGSLVRLLHKISAWSGSSVPVENIGSQDYHASSPDRPVRRAKKRLGRLAHLLFSIIPSRFQRALGYLPADGMGQSGIPEEIQKSPVKPSGKGSKRKQDDVALEEHQSWVEILQQELPEDDEAEDSTYETQSETDSEEYRSQNDTETDLEFEEKDGVLVLKASLSLQLWESIMMALDQSMDPPNDHFTKVNQARCGFMEPAAAEGTLDGENMLAAASSNTQEQQATASDAVGDMQEQQAAASGSGGDALEQQAAASGSGGDALEQQAAASGSGGDALE